MNDTAVLEPAHTTIHGWFEAVAAAYPNSPAITSLSASYTYRELNERANQVARVLISNGLEQGEFVSILWIAAWIRSSRCLVFLKQAVHMYRLILNTPRTEQLHRRRHSFSVRTDNRSLVCSSPIVIFRHLYGASDSLCRRKTCRVCCQQS